MAASAVLVWSVTCIHMSHACHMAESHTWALRLSKGDCGECGTFHTFSGVTCNCTSDYKKWIWKSTWLLLSCLSCLSCFASGFASYEAQSAQEKQNASKLQEYREYTERTTCSPLALSSCACSHRFHNDFKLLQFGKFFWVDCVESCCPEKKRPTHSKQMDLDVMHVAYACLTKSVSCFSSGVAAFKSCSPIGNLRSSQEHRIYLPVLVARLVIRTQANKLQTCTY